MLSRFSLIILLFGIVTPAWANDSKLTSEDIATRTLKATVYLKMQNNKGNSIGSGFFVTRNVVATNYHVIKNATQGTARLVGKSKEYAISGVIGYDTVNDLALLKIGSNRVKRPSLRDFAYYTEGNLPSNVSVDPLVIGDSDSIKVGQAVYVAGNPRGWEGTFSSGIISSIRGNKDIQITAPISPGSSGGPVLNDKGEVIGISRATFTKAQNLNFAVPSNKLRDLLSKFQKSKPKPLPIHESESVTKQKQVNLVTYYNKKGNTEYRNRRYTNAIAYYDAAIRIDPKNAELYFNRAMAKRHQSNPFAALVDLNSAILYRKDYGKAYYYRGIIKYHQKRRNEAKRDLQKASWLAKKAGDTTLEANVQSTINQFYGRR